MADIPDDAFTPIEGDDRAACAALKKLNRRERAGFGELFVREDAATHERLRQAAAALDALPDTTIPDIQRKEAAFTSAQSSYDFQRQQLLADAWCAAFVICKTTRPGTTEPVGITQRHLNDLADGRSLSDDLAAEVKRLRQQYRFFHWHLAFPEVFARGGFDVNLSNPPWERIKLQEKEWFAERRPDIANAPNATTRKRLIESLHTTDPVLFQQFADAVRQAEGESHFLRNGGRYPLCGRGDINLYAIFAEQMRNLLNPTGHMGAVLPTGIATDDTTKFFFQDIVEKESLVSLFSFENEEFIFPAVHHSTKFCLLTLSGLNRNSSSAEFVFLARRVEDLHDDDRRFTLSASDVKLLNPNTQTCPIFRFARDAVVSKAIYKTVPVLVNEALPMHESWSLKIRRVFDMNKQETLRLCIPAQNQNEADGYSPMFEAKMVFQFDHRFGTYEGQTGAQANQGKLPETDLTKRHTDPMFRPRPRYFIPSSMVKEAVCSLSAKTFLTHIRCIPATRNMILKSIT